MYAYHAFSTKDFDHWVDHGSVLTGRDVSWNAGGALWDGDAGIPANGQFYAYAPFRMNAATEANYGRYDIGVFTAKAVAGPYKDVFGAPMKTLDGAPLEGLSPAVIQGDDGAPYLIWGSGDTDKHEVWLGKLDPDRVRLAAPPRRRGVREKDDCGNLDYFESPMLFKAAGKWYLTYVAYKDAKGGKCDAKGSYVEYVVADSMFGPFDGPARHLIYPAPGGEESTQQGICQYRDKWYLAYHVPYDDVVPYSDHHRQVVVTSLDIRPDGSLAPIHPETDRGVGTPGVAHLTLDAFAPRREAAEFHVRSHVSGEKGLSGEYQMKMKAGGYLQFHDMEFGRGAESFTAEVGSPNAGLRDAVLEVRLDGPAGPKVGALTIAPAAASAGYQRLTGRIDASLARGRHDLALVARGRGGDTKGHLFDITWFAFGERAAMAK
jgi:hypothetical protein